MSKLTLVTGLWNIKRDELGEGWSRSFEHYLEKFDQLLKVDNNMIIFGDSSLEEFVFQRRSKDNTLFISRSTDWFKNEFFNKIQEIRTDENWYSQAGWLSESTQARLEMYNPLVMSKVFLLHDAKVFDPFDSEHMFWIDAGLTNTVHQGYFTHDKVLDKLPKYINKFSFVCFPYEANNEIHGFKFSEINNIAGTKVELVGRGGFFGGPKNTIGDINSIYYNILQSTLSQNLMGTEESIFSIMVYKHADMVDYFEIESNGLFGKFFEDLKNDSLVRKNKENLLSPSDDLDVNNAALYVITFNSPKQFETLIESMNQYDSNFLSKPKKFLLDNSSDLTTTDRYKELCEQHGFEHIKKDNLGICGGRQWIAEHAEENEFDFYFFFEDDMFFYPKKGEVCRNGFNRYTNDLYNKVLTITKKFQYDSNFLGKPKKFLLDNSSDLTTTDRYKELCEQHGFEHIKKDNLGICGGRQWIAEHAEENEFDFYFFFEDDMFFHPKKGEVCRNGFNRYTNDLYHKTLTITKKYQFDFLKMNYSEFYGDNGVQWSWYNVPQSFREQHWPGKSKLPVQGIDPNAPRTKFNHIRTHQGVSFVDGEIYYCNWPQVVTKHGNRKMFLTEKWARPFEQTWMSYIFQETIKGNIKPAMLLMTPTEHDRFDFYDGKLRKES